MPGDAIALTDCNFGPCDSDAAAESEADRKSSCRTLIGAYPRAVGSMIKPRFRQR